MKHNKYLFFFLITSSLFTLNNCSSVDKRIKQEQKINPQITDQEVMDKMMKEKVDKMEKEGNSDLTPEYLKRQYSYLDTNDYYSQASIVKYKKISPTKVYSKGKKQPVKKFNLSSSKKA